MGKFNYTQYKTTNKWLCSLVSFSHEHYSLNNNKKNYSLNNIHMNIVPRMLLDRNKLYKKIKDFNFFRYNSISSSLFYSVLLYKIHIIEIRWSGRIIREEVLIKRNLSTTNFVQRKLNLTNSSMLVPITSNMFAGIASIHLDRSPANFPPC